MPLLPCVEVEPRVPATAAVLWLHGLGADGHDFAPVVPELGLPPDAPIRFVFPHAPSIPVTINRGHVMPAWYDILELGGARRVDETGLLRSAQAVRALIERAVARGIDSRRIVIAGFSQGGAVGYQVALTHPAPLAGLLALSTWFATVDSIVPDPANRALPVSIHHGLYDPVLPESLGRAGYETLLRMGYTAEYLTWPMEHSLCMPQVAHIGAWLAEHLLATPLA